jgi:ATP-dependent Lon protease
MPQHTDEDIADTEDVFRMYMRKLFPRTRNLEAHLNAIDAIMDQNQAHLPAGSKDGEGGKGKKPRGISAARKGGVSSRQKHMAVADSSADDVSNDSGTGDDTESEYEDDDYAGPVQLNVIFAVGAPLEDDDDDDSEWEEETGDDDSEEGGGEDDPDCALEFLEMLQNSAQHRYNTRSKTKSAQFMEIDFDDDSARSIMQNAAGSYKHNRSEGKTKKTRVKEVDKIEERTESEVSVDEGEPALKSTDDLVSYFLENGEDAFREKFAEKVTARKVHIEEQLAKRRQKETRDVRKKNTGRFKKALQRKNAASNLSYFTKLDPSVQEDILSRLDEVNADMNSGTPSKIALLQTNIPVQYKVHAMRKLGSLANMDPSSGEYYKVKQWVDGFMKLPFGKRSDMPVQMGESDQGAIATFMEDARAQLDGVTYGMEDAKSQIMQLVGQWVANPSSHGTAIGIKGPMGTGKTTLVKHGVSKILERPFAFITLGGATDSSYLEGHSYTYEGSVWGQIATILMQAQSMNPVIYFDELDKVSDTAKGQEIIGILTHLTDTTQNSEFHDKYFAGINFDLSGALFIFSYNDESMVNPILRDRMHVIETKGYNAEDKRAIARQFLIPEVESTINFSEGDIVIDDDILDHITRTHTCDENGVRNLKRCLENIYAKLNVSRLAGSCASILKSSDMVEFATPFTVTRDIVDTLLKAPTRDVPPNMYC